MAREPQYGVTINGWERLLASLEANAQDFPQLEVYRTQLAAMLQTAREAAAQQAAMAAGKQEASQRLQTVLVEGRKMATFLRIGVKRQYGDKSEKLVEFGLQPFRSRPRATAESKEPAPPPPAPAEPQQ
ncbi:MAG TPA: hypothetical protein VF789_33750 [Thermoanaerobaculia bacterium]